MPAMQYGNLINPLDPSSAINAYQIQRQQALAQALQQQSLTPMTADIPQNMPIMPKLGIGNGLVKLAQALMAGNASEAADQAAGSQQQANMASMLHAMSAQGGEPIDQSQAALQMGAQQGSVGPTAENAARMAAMPQTMPSRPSPLNPTGVNPQAAALAFQLDPQKYLESVVADSARTPEMKNNAAMGYTPQMQLAAQLAADKVKGEIERKAGNQYQNFMTGQTGMVPKIPENSQIVGGIAPNGSVPGGVAPIPGASGVQQMNADTVARAGANFKLEPVFNPATGGKDLVPASTVADAGRGNITEQNIRQVADVNSIPPALNTPSYLAELDKEIARQNDPARRAILLQERDRMTSQTAAKPFAAEAPAGFDKGQVSSQEELSKAYTAQREAHQQAQTTNSYLEEIVQQAKKAAVGPQADKIQFVNGLLSQVGSDRATDVTTANNLLDKYSNQIVARLGGGGMGTDAAREILKAAYPSAKMNLPAIEEAASNIKGANAMTMARTAIVAPYGDKRDPVAYNQAARQFDQNADPRIFQFMQLDKAGQSKFLAKMAPAERADFTKRGKALESLGVSF